MRHLIQSFFYIMALLLVCKPLLANKLSAYEKDNKANLMKSYSIEGGMFNGKKGFRVRYCTNSIAGESCEYYPKIKGKQALILASSDAWVKNFFNRCSRMDSQADFEEGFFTVATIPILLKLGLIKAIASGMLANTAYENYLSSNPEVNLEEVEFYRRKIEYVLSNTGGTLFDSTETVLDIREIFQACLWGYEKSIVLENKAKYLNRSL